MDGVRFDGGVKFDKFIEGVERSPEDWDAIEDFVSTWLLVLFDVDGGDDSTDLSDKKLLSFLTGDGGVMEGGVRPDKGKSESLEDDGTD